ncbi:MAG: hypothetical protein P1P79_09185 [Lutibacter sp.]|nr:hypothetical protein [Lutibacter sp.]
MKNWFCFFNKDQSDRIDTLKSKNLESYKTWLIFSVSLPLATYLISVILNFLINGFCKWGEIMNNGSLSIISFGIISSGIPYILEKLQKDDIVIEDLRKRVMAISVLLMFLSSAWFVFQTTSVQQFSNNTNINLTQHLIVFISSLFLLILSVRNSENLFLLQKKLAEDTLPEVVEKGVQKHGANWNTNG